MIRRLLRWSRYDHGVTLDPDYEIVPVPAPPVVPATPVTVTGRGGRVWSPGARGVLGDHAEHEQRCTQCHTTRLGLLARGEEFTVIRWHYPAGPPGRCPGTVEHITPSR